MLLKPKLLESSNVAVFQRVSILPIDVTAAQNMDAVTDLEDIAKVTVTVTAPKKLAIPPTKNNAAMIINKNVHKNTKLLPPMKIRKNVILSIKMLPLMRISKNVKHITRM